MRGTMRAGWIAAALLVAPAAVGAQGLTFAGGARLYGEGEEEVLVAAVRSEFPVGSLLILEFASSLADVPANVPRATGSVFEVQLQVPVPIGPLLAPYFGAGAGVAYTHRNGASDGLDPVFSAGAGARWMLTGQLGLTLDARLRGIGTGLEGDHADVTLGLRYVFRY